MRLTSIFILWTLLWLGASSIHAGEVWTNDGRIFTGPVRLEGDGAIVVGGTGTMRLRLDDILYAWLGNVKPAGVAGIDIPAAIALTPQAIGTPRPGQLSFQSTGIYTLRGIGKGIRGQSDGLSLFSRGVSGDVQMTARIREVGPAPGVVALMLRTDMDPGSPFAMIGVTPQGDFSFRYRTEPGGHAIENNIAAKLKFPLWLKIVRRGRNSTWFKSQTGMSWQVGGQIFTDREYGDWKNAGSKPPEPGISFGDRISAGIAIASGGTNEVRALVDKLQVQELEPDRSKSTPAGPAAPVSENASSFIPVLLADTAKGVALTDGTFLPRATLFGADEKSVTIADAAGKELQVPAGRMARVNLSPIAGPLAASMPSDLGGVLLASSGFMEGQIKSIRDDRVTVSSVVFGLSAFKLGDDVRAVSWHAISERSSAGVITLNDGTSFGASSFKVDQGDIVIAGPTLGTRRALSRDVNVVRGSAERAVPLARLSPSQITGTNGESVVVGSALDAVWGNLFMCSGRGAWLGVATPTGAEVTYSIPPGTKRFTCWVGIPDQGGAGGSINFTIDIDGKTITKSHPIKVDPTRPMAFLSIPIDGRILTLCAESETRDADPGYVCWGDAVLSK